MEQHRAPQALPGEHNLRRLDHELLTLTELDRNGRFLMEYFCEAAEETNWPDQNKWHVYAALELMYDAHGEQGRGNGDAYITHPLRVAIDLCLQGAPPELVAAGLLHDTVEDTPEAVIKELATSTPETHLDADATIEHALKLLHAPGPYQSAAPLVDGVTNRAYPPEVRELTGDALIKGKHEFRANQINEHVERSELEAWLKFADTYDNIRTLVRHEALNGTPEQSQNLANLIAKYRLMIERWQSLVYERPPVIDECRIDICHERLEAAKVSLNAVPS